MRMGPNNFRTYPLRTREFLKWEGMVKHQGVGAHGSGTKREEAYWTHLMFLVDPYDVFYFVFCHICMGLLSYLYGLVESRVIWVFIRVHIKGMCG